MINDIISLQIKHEFNNCKIYFYMFTYFDKMQLNGFAKYFKKQSIEEHEHAMRITEFANIIGYNLELENWDVFKIPKILSIQQAIKLYHEVELETTRNMESIYKIAFDKHLFTAATFFSEMVKEQIEELNNSSNLLQKIELIGSDKSALLFLDKEML